MPIFDSASLHTAVSAALKDSSIDDTHMNAFALVATRNGVKAVLAAKINNVWSVESVVSVDDQKHVDGGVSVKATW